MADFTWQGAAAYTPPGTTAADFTWAEGPPPSVGSASGFFGTVIGQPVSQQQQTYSVSGFSETAFGQPALQQQVYSASGFGGTAFGSASASSTQAYTASSVSGSDTLNETIISDSFTSPVGAITFPRTVTSTITPPLVWTSGATNPSITADGWAVGDIWSPGSRQLMLDAGEVTGVPVEPLVIRATVRKNGSSIYGPRILISAGWYDGGPYDFETGFHADVQILNNRVTLTIGDELGWTTITNSKVSEFANYADQEPFELMLVWASTSIKLYLDGLLVKELGAPAVFGLGNAASRPVFTFGMSARELDISSFSLTSETLAAPLAAIGSPGFTAATQTQATGDAAATAFGTPNVAIPAQVGVATATTATTALGTPVGLFSMVPPGFSSTTFGSATASAVFVGQSSTVGVPAVGATTVLIQDDLTIGAPALVGRLLGNEASPAATYTLNPSGLVVAPGVGVESYGYAIFGARPLPGGANQYRVAVTVRDNTTVGEYRQLSIFPEWYADSGPAFNEPYATIYLDDGSAEIGLYSNDYLDEYRTDYVSSPANAAFVMPVGSTATIALEITATHAVLSFNGTEVLSLALPTYWNALAADGVQPVNGLLFGAQNITVTAVNAQASSSVVGALEPATKFGTPNAAALYSASSVAPTTTLPTAYYPFNQTLAAAALSASARFGAGYVFNMPAPPLENYTLVAYGFRPSVFGEPVAAGAITPVASGFASGIFGTPRARASYLVQGFGSTALSTPILSLRGRAAGFRSTVVPAISSAPTSGAASISPRPRFGVAKAIQPNVFPAYGLTSTRVGHPRSVQFFGRQVEGWVAAVLGEPLGYSTLRARMNGPSTHMGRPTLRRTPEC